MKHLCAIALLTLSLSAAPFACPPVSSGSTPVQSSCPGVGAKVFATPGTSGSIWWEDLPSILAEPDYNDQRDTFTIDPSGLFATFAWAGSTASINSALYSGATFLFSNDFHPASVVIPTTPNQEIVLTLKAGLFSWSTGPGPRNFDGLAHAYVEQSAVPEPATASMIGTALILICIAARRRRP